MTPRVRLFLIRALVAASATAGALSFLSGCAIRGPLGGSFSYTPPGWTGAAPDAPAVAPAVPTPAPAK